MSYPGVHAAHSFKPDRTFMQSEKALDDRTIYKVNYVPQSMEQVERYPTPDWLKQQEFLWQQQSGKVQPPSSRPIGVAA